jgi:hypothetical protein
MFPEACSSGQQRQIEPPTPPRSATYSAWAAADAPGEIKTLGLLADDGKRLLAAEIGKLRSQMTAASSAKTPWAPKSQN